MSVVMPKQSADPSKPPRRGNPPWRDILLGVGALVLAVVLLALVAGSRRVSARGVIGGVAMAIAGPFLIIRGIVNLVRDGQKS